MEEILNVPPEEHFPRFTLADNEHVCVIATYVAAGRSDEINLLPEQRQSWFLSFANSLSWRQGGGGECNLFHVAASPDGPAQI